MKETARFAGLLLPEPERSRFLERIRPLLPEADFRVIEQLIRAVPEVLGLLEQRGMSIERLRRIAFGAATEKTCGWRIHIQAAIGSSNKPVQWGCQP